MKLRHYPLVLCFGALPCWAAELPRVLVSSPDEAFRQTFTTALTERGAKATAAPVPSEALLAQADVLVLHAAEPTPLAPELKTALQAFAARGGGFVVVRGGIAGGDASWWKPLIGGAWTPQSRKFSNRMMLYTTTDAHPIVKQASPFDLTDETIYDLDLAKDVQVLGSAFTPKVTTKRENVTQGAQDRANIYDLQPQLWAYESPAPAGGAAHRALVALQGSTATLQHRSFLTFLLRGVAWAGRQENVDALCQADDLKDLRYPVDGPSRPQDTLRKMDLHPGFKLSVVASEPLVTKPIAAQWDAKGRLWVAETPEYPNGRRPTVAEPWKETGVLKPGSYDRPAIDSIGILKDTNGDGVMDQKTVFYEGLELVTGFCFYRDGVIALHQPDIVWLRDTNGDDKVDKVERLFSGFTPGDTHFVANHLTPGPDGWIYVSMGGDANVTKPDSKELLTRVTSGVFRFKPDGSAIEQYSSKGGNGFGLDLTSDFEVYFNQATSGNPIQHVVLPESVLAKGKLGQINGASPVISQRKVMRPQMPDRAALMQIDVVGGFSSACASLIYEGGAWPKEFTGGAFCTEPILNIIRHEAVSPEGPTFKGQMLRPDKEFLFSHDYWFRPFDLAPGPDGAVYILDFYSPVVAHSDSRGPQHSRSGASVRPDRDHFFGRIYRLQSEQEPAWTVPDLTVADTKQLAQALTHPNRTVRFNAFHLLVDRPADDVASAVRSLATTGQPEARILALWALQRVNRLAATELVSAAQAEDARVRKNAALIAEQNPKLAGLVLPDLLADLVASPEPRLRLVALRALSQGQLSAKASAAILTAYPTLTDDWSRSAAVAAASSNPSEVLRAALKLENTAPIQDFVRALLTGMVERKDVAAFGQLLDAAAGAPASADPIKRALLDGAASLTTPLQDNPSLTVAVRILITSENPEVSSAALAVAARWTPELHGTVKTRLAPLIAELERAETPEARRTQLAVILIHARAIAPECLPAVTRALTGPTSGALKRRIITALGEAGDAMAGQALITSFGRLNPAEQDAAFNVVLARPEWTGSFLAAMEKKELNPADLGPSNLFRLRTHPSKPLAERAAKLLDQVRQANPDKDAIVARLLPIISQPGDIAKGRELYANACAVCHKFNDQGTEVGPVLTGMGAHGAANLLVHIVDPNRAIDAGYEVWNIETTDGQFQSGILAQENDSRLVLKMPGTQVEVPKDKIKTRTNTHRSLMPEGLEALGGEALRDLLAYLCENVGQYRVLDLGKVFTADGRRGLYHSSEALNDSIKFQHFGLQTVAGVPFQVADPEKSAIGGNLVVLRGGGERDFAFSFPKQVEIPVGQKVKALHFLGGVAGWGGGPVDNGPVAMTVKLVFADGTTEAVPLRAGEVFIDYVSSQEVSGSKRAAGLVKDGKHVRTFTVPVPAKGVLQKIILESPGRGPAPTTAAITVEVAK